jgi:hypothetical protein
LSFAGDDRNRLTAIFGTIAVEWRTAITGDHAGTARLLSIFPKSGVSSALSSHSTVWKGCLQIAQRSEAEFPGRNAWRKPPSFSAQILASHHSGTKTLPPHGGVARAGRSFTALKDSLTSPAGFCRRRIMSAFGKRKTLQNRSNYWFFQAVPTDYSRQPRQNA